MDATEWATYVNGADLYAATLFAPGGTPVVDCPNPSERKSRRIAIAICREYSNYLDKNGRMALQVAELYADKATRDNRRRLDHWHGAAAQSWADLRLVSGRSKTPWAKYYAMRLAVAVSAATGVSAARQCLAYPSSVSSTDACVVVRDILHPFDIYHRKGTEPKWSSSKEWNPAWESETACAIARNTYKDRSFEDMPILADALEDAGCEDQAILGHCRNGLDHFRGCWVLDLILGKS